MAKYKSRGEAIKDLRKSEGLSQEELAKMLDTTKQTIYKYENGIVTNIPSDKIEEMSRIFSVSPAVIMGWADNEHDTPVYEIAAGHGRICSAPVGTMRMELEDGQFVATVKGRSMEPTLMDGDQVIINSQTFLDRDGQIAMVKVNGDENTLKRVQISDAGLTLVADNPSVFPTKFYTAEEVQTFPITIMGVVTKLIRDL
jgi:repressor LexA